MKKFALWATALSAAVVLAIVGCNNPTSSDNTPAPVEEDVDKLEGVYGTLVGVVYDKITGLPVEGATVTIGAGKYSGKTDESGTYIIPEVTPGTYGFSITKDGFLAFNDSTAVDAQQYQTDDPYLEVAYLQEQIDVFQDWLKAYAAANGFPFESEGAALASGSWNYDGNGVYLDGNSEAAVTITNAGTNTDFPKFEVTSNKLDYAYTYAIEVDFVQLTPLTGGFTGKIEVFYETNASFIKGDPAPASGVEIYFRDTATGASLYGPYTTGTNGSFEASSLPANMEFDIVLAPFTLNDYYFAPDATNIYSPGQWTAPLTTLAFTTSANEGYANIGTLVIFTEGKVVYITGGNVPNAGAPFGINDSITLIFSKAIATGSFTAVLNFGGNAEYTSATSQALQTSWNAAGTTVTLTAGQKLDGYNSVSLPYSIDPSKAVGELTVNGKALDGSTIFGIGASDPIDVYTVGALALNGVEYIAASAAPARAVAEVGGAIKLTFNKPLAQNNPATKFTVDGEVAYFVFDNLDSASVYVYTDIEIAANGQVHYTVVSATDPNDQSDEDLYSTPELEVGVRQLVLKSTNLYIDGAGIPQTPDITNGIFAGSVIEFTFNEIPADVKPVLPIVEFKDNGASIAAPAIVDDNTVKITPAQLKRNITYTLSLKIVDKDNRVIYKNPGSGGTAAQVGFLYIDAADLISFKTADVAPVALIATNLYIDPVTGVNAGLGSSDPTDGMYNVAFDSDIVLTFDQDIPSNAIVNVVLGDSSYNAVKIAVPVVVDNTITIDPVADLTPGNKYYLSVKVIDAANSVFWQVPTSQNGINVASNAGVNYIGFSTLPVTLVGTNLYRDDIPGIPTASTNAYFPLDGTIELEFDSIPAGTKIAPVILATSTNQTAGLNVYAAIDFDNNKVTVKPNAKLTADTPYYLRVILYKTVVADSVWSADVTSSGVSGPVYIFNATNGDEIGFRTAADSFAVRASGAPSATNLTDLTGVAGANFNANNDIIVEFDQPIASVAKAQVLYVAGPYSITAQISGVPETVGDTLGLLETGNLSLDRKVLTIKTTNLLTNSATFSVRLNVTAENGQQIVYDSTNTGDPSAWANTYNGDLQFTTGAATYITGSSKRPASAGTLSYDGTAPAVADGTLTLALRPGAVPTKQITYTIYGAQYNIWDPTAIGGVTIVVPVGTLTSVSVAATGTVNLPGATPHIQGTAEGIQYKVRGINNAGYVTEAIYNVSFAP
jgi:hypothetical protein